MKTISFKSTSMNFYKEKSGIKSNTVRFTDDWDLERWNKIDEATHVQICNKDNPKDKFQRKIKDKTIHKNVVIISW